MKRVQREVFWLSNDYVKEELPEKEVDELAELVSTKANIDRVNSAESLVNDEFAKKIINYIKDNKLIRVRVKLLSPELFGTVYEGAEAMIPTAMDKKITEVLKAMGWKQRQLSKEFGRNWWWLCPEEYARMDRKKNNRHLNTEKRLKTILEKQNVTELSGKIFKDRQELLKKLYKLNKKLKNPEKIPQRKIHTIPRIEKEIERIQEQLRKEKEEDKNKLTN